MNGSRLIGTGSALPRRVVTNAELAARVDTSDEQLLSFLVWRSHGHTRSEQG